MSFTSPGLPSQPTSPVTLVSVLGTASSLAANRRRVRTWQVEDVGAYPIESDCADVDAQQGLLPSTRVDAQYVTVLDPLLRDQ